MDIRTLKPMPLTKKATPVHAGRVIHKRKSGGKITDLVDPRDIYELVANQASRRIRSCILQIIPGDITEEALKACAKSKVAGEGPLEDRIKKMVVAFQAIGVTAEMLEAYMGHELEVTVVDEVTALISIYQTIKDGEAKREDFFDLTPRKEGAAQADKGAAAPKGNGKTNGKAAAPAAPKQEKPATTPAVPPKTDAKPEHNAGSLLQQPGPQTADPFGGEPENSGFTVICPNTDRPVDELDCVNKSCRKGCPAFEG